MFVLFFSIRFFFSPVKHFTRFSVFFFIFCRFTLFLRKICAFRLKQPKEEEG